MSTAPEPVSHPLDGVERVYRVDEVALHLGITRQSAYRLVRDGRLRAVKVGRLVRVPQSGLDEFLHSRGKAA